MPTNLSAAPAQRITSIDALRGFVMFTMIYVNDLNEDLSPPWMKHFHGPNGMTFVDLVFPAFMFIVGLSIPVAMTIRLSKGDSPIILLGHVIVRTLSLLAIGIMMVNAESLPRAGSHFAKLMPLTPTHWEALMFLSGIFAFCSIGPSAKSSASAATRKFFTFLTIFLRNAGLATLVILAFNFRSRHGGRIITLQPFSIHTDWYGILGMIGWVYLIASVAFLIFRTNRAALVAVTALLMCLYPAAKTGLFNGLWIADHVRIGDILGSQGAIAVAGVLLGTIFLTPETESPASRTRFTLLFSAGFSIAALLTYGLYGISKNAGTPSWCFWSIAITAILWLIFYFVADVWKLTWISKPWAIAGQNVLLAYLLSELLESALDTIHLGDWYDSLAEPTLGHAIARSVGCGIVLLTLTAVLNRVGFRLKL
jgi:heparan-alpha-glucosaminide N-acetyltransferase